jgi:hypothetical protein
MNDFTAGLFNDYLYNLEAFIDSGRGQITIGPVKPVRCAALASEGCTALVSLVRRDGETIANLLARLDLALGRVAVERIGIDEFSAHIKAHHKPRK